MVWRPRVCGEELYHHIYAWGNDRHPVFKKPSHYQKYVDLLARHARQYQTDVLAYALMDWHVHLFIYDAGNNISEFMQRLHGDYAQYFNRTTHRVGHVFGERFNNKIVQADVYGMWLTRYIHRQALDAGLVSDPKDYPWTSYSVYLGLKRVDFIKPQAILEQFGSGNAAIEQYAKFVLDGDDGPIDWSSKKIKMIKTSVIIDVICRSSKIDHRVLMEPQGWAEKRKRREAIRIMVKKYGLTPAVISKTLHVSITAVRKILTEK